MSKRHKDLEFAVDDASGHQKTFKTFEEAAGFTIAMASSNGSEVNIDVLCWSKAAAKAWGVEEQYEEDPEASVTDRITIRAEHVGRVA
jgi:hypothetical protein